MRERIDPSGDAGSVQYSEGRGNWGFPHVLPSSTPEKGCRQTRTLVSDQPEALVFAGLVILDLEGKVAGNTSGWAVEWKIASLHFKSHDFHLLFFLWQMRKCP